MTTQTKTTWGIAKLGELVIPRGSVSGPFGSNIHSKFFTHEGVPVIRGNNLAIGFNPGTYIDDDYIFLSEEKADELSKSEALPEDIIVTARGTIGQTGIIPKKSRYKRYILSANQLRFRIDRKVADPLFVYYWLASKRMVKMMQNVSVNVGVPNLNLGNTRNLPVPTPPLPTQEKIADILSAFDDKIELNNKISAALEQMAQAIFKEWFVKNQKSNLKNQKLGDFAEITMGQSPASQYYNEQGDGLPFHQGVTNFGVRFPLHRVYCTENRRIAEKGDVLLSVRAPVGRINLANTKISLGRGLAGIREKNNRQSFIYYFLKYRFQKEDSLGGGSVFPAVTRKDLEEIPILLPSEGIIDRFEQTVAHIDKKIEVVTNENQKLAALRDLLLPKLMSGEIKV